MRLRHHRGLSAPVMPPRSAPYPPSSSSASTSPSPANQLGRTLLPLAPSPRSMQIESNSSPTLTAASHTSKLSIVVGPLGPASYEDDDLDADGELESPVDIKDIDQQTHSDSKVVSERPSTTTTADFKQAEKRNAVTGTEHDPRATPGITHHPTAITQTTSHRTPSSASDISTWVFPRSTSKSTHRSTSDTQLSELARQDTRTPQRDGEMDYGDDAATQGGHPGEKTPVAAGAVPAGNIRRPGSGGSSDDNDDGQGMTGVQAQHDPRAPLMSPFGQPAPAQEGWTPQTQSSASFANDQRHGPTPGYGGYGQVESSEAGAHHPHAMYAGAPPGAVPGMAYPPGAYRAPEGGQPAGPGGELPVAYSYHHGGYMGPPPPPGYGYAPYPTAPMTDENGNVVHPQAAGYPYGAYHPQHYMAYPGMTHSPYAGSPDVNASMMGGPPGVVFARASDPRIIRPKVKLTYEDKRRIVEIARGNSSLRQEDIAQQYGVDRSTISKILIQQHRWMGPAQPTVVPIPKPIKQTGGGRFPAIEKRMDDWMDEQFKLGYEIRDQVARDKAKEIAREMGFTEERFKASAKWLDKFKERRRANGLRASVTATFESSRPNLTLDSSNNNSGSGSQGSPDGPSAASSVNGMVADPAYASAHNGQFYVPYHPQAGGHVIGNQYSPGGSRVPILSRSQSSATLASSDSGNPEAFAHHQYAHLQARGMHAEAVKSESDLLGSYGHYGGPSGPPSAGTTDEATMITSGRPRSMSSPQARNFQLPPDVSTEPGHLAPSSGRASKPLSAGGLARQNSFAGGSSPRRPTSQLSRSNSATSSLSGRRSARPGSLAASAFGLTPMGGQEDGTYSPSHGSGSSVSSHVPRDGHAGTLHPFSTSHLSAMSISSGSHGSLSASSSSTSVGQGGQAPQPMTPLSASMYSDGGRQQAGGHYYQPSQVGGPIGGHPQQSQPGYGYGYPPQHYGAIGQPAKAEVGWREG